MDVWTAEHTRCDDLRRSGESAPHHPMYTRTSAKPPTLSSCLRNHTTQHSPPLVLVHFQHIAATVAAGRCLRGKPRDFSDTVVTFGLRRTGGGDGWRDCQGSPHESTAGEGMERIPTSAISSYTALAAALTAKKVGNKPIYIVLYGALCTTRGGSHVENESNE